MNYVQKREDSIQTLSFSFTTTADRPPCFCLPPTLLRKLNFPIMMSTIALIWVGSLSSEAILIDGNPSDWTGITPLVSSDPNEADIPDDDYDLENFYVTNDNTDMFFRLDVYGTPTLTGVFPVNPAFYQIYLDIDQNTNTGTLINGIGADRIIDYGSFDDVNVYDGTWTAVGTGAQSGTTEISVPLSDLGLQYCMTVNMFAYLDNGGPPPDDLVPDTGYVDYHVIPEPATWLLLSYGGIGGLLAFRRKNLYRKVKRSSIAGII